VLQQLISKIKKTNYARKLYFENAVDEIAELNLSILKIISAITTVMILVLILLAKIIIIDWTPSLAHILFVPTTALFTLISFIYGQQRNVSKKFVDYLCLLFCTNILIFVIIIDVFYNSEAPSSFMQLVIIVLPILFIYQFRVIYTFMFAFEILYGILICCFKTPRMFQNDLYNSVVALFIFIFLTWITMNLRVDSYNAKNKYRQLSKFDELTGVLNKKTFEKEMIEYFKNQYNSQRCSLFIIDIDNYKLVNDRLGHQIGDEVLGKVGQMLIHSFDTTDIIGRIGGDEFAVLINNVTDKNVLKKKCDLLYSKAKSISENVNFNVCFSIDIAIQKDTIVSFEEMFKSADDALYEAKSFGKSQCIMHMLCNEKRFDADKKVMLISVSNFVTRKILVDSFLDELAVIEASTVEGTLSNLSIYDDSIDIIIFDMNFPDIDGYKLLEYMKSRDNLINIPVIALETDSSKGDAAIKFGAADVLYKPIDEETVRLKVMEALNAENKKTVV